MRVRRVAARGVVLVFLFTLVAVPTGARASDGGLRDADQAERDAAAKAAIKGVVGKPVKVGSLLLTIRDIAFDEAIDENGTGDIARIALTVRTENRNRKKAEPLDFNLVCINHDESSGWYADSTYKMTKSLPSRSFREGVLYLGVPANCSKPRVRASQTGVFFGGKPKAADFRLPASVTDQFA